MGSEGWAVGCGQQTLGNDMQWSIRKVQRATIAAGIAVAVFACAREFDVLWRYGLWSMNLGTHVL